MAWGGLYDQIGGGFTRYSTDMDWFVPHFEKISTTIINYSPNTEAYQVSKDKYYRGSRANRCMVAVRNAPQSGGFLFWNADSEGEEVNSTYGRRNSKASRI